MMRMAGKYGGFARLFTSQLPLRGLYNKDGKGTHATKSAQFQQNLQAELRMLDQRARQVERGTDAHALQPEWCRQNEALCYLRV